MQIGMIGLGRMGSAMTRRLVTEGHACVVHDVHASAIAKALQPGVAGATTLKHLLAQLAGRTARVISSRGFTTASSTG